MAPRLVNSPTGRSATSATASCATTSGTAPPGAWPVTTRHAVCRRRDAERQPPPFTRSPAAAMGILHALPQRGTATSHTKNALLPGWLFAASTIIAGCRWNTEHYPMPSDVQQISMACMYLPPSQVRANTVQKRTSTFSGPYSCRTASAVVRTRARSASFFAPRKSISAIDRAVIDTMRVGETKRVWINERTSSVRVYDLTHIAAYRSDSVSK